MNTRWLMIISAVTLGAAGIILTFMPKEIAQFLNMPEPTSFIFQILGALYVGFAMLNWTAKANIMGGIYSRPVALGNFTHFLIGVLALMKMAVHDSHWSIGWLFAIPYALFTLLFGLVLFAHPAAINKTPIQ